MAYNNFNHNKPHNFQQRQNGNEEKFEPFIPLSLDMKTKLRNPGCNFSLYSPRMVSWKFSGKELKVDESVIKSLCEQSKKSFPLASDLLKKKNEHQEEYIKALSSQGIATFTFEAKSTSPFITGLGSGHPTETGIILDRNIGVPYIPASSIKGILRLAYAINIAKGRKEVPDEELNEYFGSMSQEMNKQSRGQLMLLDAYPKDKVSLKLDIMNPHFGSYYSGNGQKQPLETESPVPIKFLTVAKGTTFVFRCAFLPIGNKTPSDEQKSNVEAMFKTAFEKVGFGGKTAIGYGRFKDISKKE